MNYRYMTNAELWEALREIAAELQRREAALRRLPAGDIRVARRENGR